MFTKRFGELAKRDPFREVHTFLYDPKKRTYLSALHHPGFRLFWANITLSSLCSGIQDVLLAWLVLELTDSSLLFSIVLSLRFLPMLLGPICGVVADRVNRRIILLISKAVQIVVSIFLGTLVLGGQIQLWHVTVIIILQSLIGTFNLPAESAFSLDLVGKKDITNATALQRISLNLSGFVGPALVGAFVNIIGIGPFYYLNALIYLLALVSIFMIGKVPNKQLIAQKSVRGNLVDGFKYSWSNKFVFGGQLMYFFANMIPIASRRTIQWIFIREILHADTAGFGWISAGTQLGSLCTSAIIAYFGNIKRKGKIVMISSIMWGFSLILLSTSTSFSLTLLYLIVMGISGTLTMMLSQIILLINSEIDMRGRVMGIRSLAISSQFPGSIFAGAMAETFGTPFAVGLEGALYIISMLATIKFVPHLRKAE